MNEYLAIDVLQKLYNRYRCKITMFRNCLHRDVLCGTLHCDSLIETLRYPNGWVSSNNFRINIGGGYNCRSVVYEIGFDGQDRGLVPNGASCGVSKVR